MNRSAVDRFEKIFPGFAQTGFSKNIVITDRRVHGTSPMAVPPPRAILAMGIKKEWRAVEHPHPCRMREYIFKIIVVYVAIAFVMAVDTSAATENAAIRIDAQIVGGALS